VIVAGVFAGASTGAVAVAGAFAGAVSGAGGGGIAAFITALNGVALERKWQGIFLLLFVPTMILACLFAAELLSHLSSWEKTGPMLLFMGLLTLVNAPFDWASLGLTRALLRRGLELGGWWPYVLALADAALAAVIVVGLLFTIVIGVQTFGHLTQHGGGADLIRSIRY